MGQITTCVGRASRSRRLHAFGRLSTVRLEKGVRVQPTKGLLLSLALSACIEPKDRFDEFVAEKTRLAPEAGIDAGEVAGNTTPLSAEQVTGTYLYAVSTPANPSQPTVYLAEVEASELGEQLEVRMRQRALSVTDRKTPVGEFSEWITQLLDPAGSYQSPSITTVVPPEANPFGLALTTTITFTGTFRNPASAEMPDAKVEFFCGTATGLVEGLNLSLDGSTFAALRIPDPANPDSYPAVVINCNRDPAAPV